MTTFRARGQLLPLTLSNTLQTEGSLVYIFQLYSTLLRLVLCNDTRTTPDESISFFCSSLYLLFFSRAVWRAPPNFAESNRQK